MNVSTPVYQHLYYTLLINSTEKISLVYKVVLSSDMNDRKDTLIWIFVQ